MGNAKPDWDTAVMLASVLLRC